MIKLPTIKFDSIEYGFTIYVNGEPVQMTSVHIQADVRPLTVEWRPQLAHNLHAYHGIDAEGELTAILSEQIAAEIDREIIQILRQTNTEVTPTHSYRFYPETPILDLIDKISLPIKFN